tara:strand:- start:1961 stop:2191 length:231 start_codon:yes stop_codon:yes gene_type:complete
LQKKELNNCWDCLYHKKGGINLLGSCKWYFYYKKRESLEIPNTIIDKGCKFWKSDNETLHSLTDRIITKFQGVFVD